MPDLAGRELDALSDSEVVCRFMEPKPTVALAPVLRPTEEEKI